MGRARDILAFVVLLAMIAAILTASNPWNGLLETPIALKP
jgi:hypothetical protein